MQKLLYSLILLAWIPCQGQVNVEDKRMSRTKTGISGSFGISIELDRGNSDMTEIGLKPRLVYRSGPSQWFVLNSYSFVETDQGNVTDEGFSHLRYNYKATNVVVIEALTQIQYNRGQDLKRRFLLGAGIRLETINKPGLQLAVGVTGMYEYEELETGEITRTPRNSDYIALRLKRKSHFTLNNTVYFQPAFNAIGDVRILDNLKLSFALAKWLAVTLEVEYRYDSEPPAGVSEYDLSLKNGLTVSF